MLTFCCVRCRRLTNTRTTVSAHFNQYLVMIYRYRLAHRIWHFKVKYAYYHHLSARSLHIICHLLHPYLLLPSYPLHSFRAISILSNNNCTLRGFLCAPSHNWLEETEEKCWPSTVKDIVVVHNSNLWKWKFQKGFRSLSVKRIMVPISHFIRLSILTCDKLHTSYKYSNTLILK